MTCLVGKNESGKTALLTALYRTNPIITEAAVFDETYDYTKRKVEDYRFAVENGDRGKAVVVECLHELEDGDLEAVTPEFGTKVLKGNAFTRETYYGKAQSTLSLTADEAAARQHLAGNPALPNELENALKGAADREAVAAELDAAEPTEAVRTLKGLVAKVLDQGRSLICCVQMRRARRGQRSPVLPARAMAAELPDRLAHEIRRLRETGLSHRVIDTLADVLPHRAARIAAASCF